MSILDIIGGLGNACRNVTFSRDYDIRNEISNNESDRPHFLWLTKGNFDIKPIKWITAAAIFTAGVMLKKKLSPVFKRSEKEADD